MCTLEDRSHLMFHCPFSQQCWGILGIHWLEGVLMEIMMQSTTGHWVGPMFKEIIILAAWNIWKTRNNLLFEGILCFEDIINTRDMLHKRHWNIGDDFSCVLCPN